MTQFVINRETKEKIWSEESHRYFETGNIIQKPYDVGALINAIVRKGQSITADMNEWVAVGSAIANTFGEAGRTLFHDLSEMDNSYNKFNVDKTYNRVLKNPRSNINTIIGRAQKLGINTNDFWVKDDTEIIITPTKERKQEIKKEPFYIPFDYVTKSVDVNNKHSIFVQWFYDILGYSRRAKAHEVLQNYYVGATKDKKVIFWKIDKDYKVTAGKIMLYNENGHRSKDVFNSIHQILGKRKIFKEEKQEAPTQCFFGEHLLNTKGFNTKDVAIVESEKTALLCSVLFPNYVWIATSSYSYLHNEKRTQCLQGKNVILYPDTNKHDDWVKEAEKLKDICNISVSEYLIKTATEEEIKQGIDIADYLIKDLQQEKTDREIRNSEKQNFMNLLKTNIKGFSDFCDKLKLEPEQEKL